jgi:DNA-binding CsgD family transcriptional regulator
MLTRTDETELLTALHEGPFERPLWSTFLHRLRNRLDADQVLMSFRRADAPGSEVTQILAGDPTPEDQRLYFDSLYTSNPLAYRSLRPGRTYTLREMLDHADPLHATEHYRRLIELGAGHARILRILEPSGSSAWLMISRKQHDFDATDGAVMMALTPHLTITLRIYAEIEHGRTRADISGKAIRRLNFGWLALDSQGRVVDIDPAAEDFLRHVTAIRKTSSGRLALAEPEADRTFNALVRAFVDNPSARARALHISSDPWLNMLLTPIRDGTLSGDTTPAMIAYFHGDIRSSADRCEQLVDLFGLTRSEARFALELSQGRSIADAADALGLTLETGRNYSKRVYAKTGVRGQVELVRLILTSVVALA